MALEDGRFLVAPGCELGMGKKDTQQKLVPVHPQFRVIALGVPVPPFPGNPLDPPLRSRFQVKVSKVSVCYLRFLAYFVFRHAT